jgi:hypothetical protein
MNINPEGLAAIVGIFMPVVVSLVKRPEWPNWAKLAVAVLVSLGVGAASSLVSSQADIKADPEVILEAGAAAFTAATVVYKAWFGGTQWNDGLTRLPWS